MSVEGGCFCGAIRYKAEGEVAMRAICHCRQCQSFTGGGPNYFIAMPAAGFSYTKGQPNSFLRPAAPVLKASREFCPACGTHLVARAETLPDMVILKVGALDDPAVFGSPQFSVFVSDKQPFHHVAEDVPAYDRLPPI